jgi:competence protein ComEA
VAVVALAGSGLLLLLASPEPGEPRAVPELLLDPNTAPAEVLMALPRVGPVRAQAIVAARQSAPLGSLEDLERRVRGIGPATAAALQPYLRFPSERSGGPTPQPHP